MAFFRGKCAHCHHRISPRYIAVEMLAGAAFAWSAWQFDLSMTGALYALMFAIAICLFFIDLETFPLLSSQT
uniref:Peptidase A24A-like protein n=1 Tax=Polynucleobacter necessarius subsp. necessarius (strain STIR1) TaxID=452638 RepID=B1XUC3_POLNS